MHPAYIRLILGSSPATPAIMSTVRWKSYSEQKIHADVDAIDSVEGMGAEKIPA